MPIKPTFKKKQIDAMIADKMARLGQAMFRRLQLVAERFVNNARSNNTYQDQTGNLRSSIGYIIFFNGREVEANFKESGKGGSLKSGLTRPRSGGAKVSPLAVGGMSAIDMSRKLAHDVAREYPRGWVLVGVAGMIYAAAVESRGLDVITNSGKIAEHDLKVSLAQLIKKIK